MKSLRGTSSKSTHVVFCHTFSAQYLKGAVIILTVVVLDVSTLSSTNLQILVPERCNEHPVTFHLFLVAKLPLCPNVRSKLV